MSPSIFIHVVCRACFRALSPISAKRNWPTFRQVKSERREEPCCFCNAPTSAGLFVRRDPADHLLACRGGGRLDLERTAMTSRELMGATAELATMVLEYVKGPYARHNPTNANYWRANVETAFGNVIELHASGGEPEPGSERMWIQVLAKLVSWLLPIQDDLGYDSPASRANLAPYIRIVLREGFLRGQARLLKLNRRYFP